MKNINEALFEGFTIVEVMIVTVILGVIAGLAVPSYTSSVEQSRANEAQANLNVIYRAEKIYKIDKGAFWPTDADPTIDEINAALTIDLAPPQFYSPITIVAGGSGATATFTATATRNGGSWSGRTASIDQTGNYTPP